MQGGLESGGRLHLEVEAQRETPAVIDHVEDLIRIAAMGAIGRIVQIEALEEDRKLLGNVVARAEIDLRRRIDEVGSEPKAELFCCWPK